MKTMRLTERPADGIAGEPDDPPGSSTGEPRQHSGRTPGGGRAPDTRCRPSDAPARPPADEPAAGLEIHDNTGRCGRDALAWLTQHAARAIDEALARHNHAPATPSDSVRVLIVDDRHMADQHLRLCGVPGTTDVITIDLNRDADAAGAIVRPLDADLLVCLCEAVRQAAQRGHAVERELLLYVLHGVLHCLGHDDHDDRAFEAMHAMEDAVLDAIGVGAVFAADGAWRDQADHAPRGDRTPGGPR